jgi:hypothetical protein
VGGKVIFDLYGKYIEIDDTIGYIMQQNSKLLTAVVFILFASVIGAHIGIQNPNPFSLAYEAGHAIQNLIPFSSASEHGQITPEMIEDARRALRNTPYHAPIDYPIYPLEYHPSAEQESEEPYAAQMLPLVLESIAKFAAILGLVGGATILTKQYLEELFGVPIQELHQLLCL